MPSPNAAHRVWILPLIVVVGCGAPKPSEPAAPKSVDVVVPSSVDASAPSSEAPSSEAPADASASTEAAPSPREAEPLERTAPRHRSKRLDEAPRPSKIAAGDYVCRIDAGYKLRPCSVTVDERGFTWLEIPSGLIPVKGVLSDEGNAVVFDGAPTEERPFGCFSCQERCTKEPGTCMCQELLPDASRECLARPVVVRLTKKGQGYTGWLDYVTYFNRYEGTGDERHVAGWDPQRNRFLFEIQPAKP